MAKYTNPFGEDKPRPTRGGGKAQRGFKVRNIPKDPNNRADVKAAIKAFEYLSEKHRDDTVHQVAISEMVTNGCVEVDIKTLSKSMKQLVALAAEGKLHTVFITLPWDNGTFKEGEMIALRFDQDRAFGNDNIVRTCQASAKPGSGYTHIFKNHADYFDIAQDIRNGTVVVNFSLEHLPIGHLELLDKNSPPAAPESGWPIKNKDKYNGPYTDQNTPEKTRGDNYLNISDLNPSKYKTTLDYVEKLKLAGQKPLTVTFRRKSVTRYKEESPGGTIKNIAPEMLQDAELRSLDERRFQTGSEKDFMGKAWAPEVKIDTDQQIPLNKLKKQWQVKTHLAGLIAQGPVKVIDDATQRHLFTLTPLDYANE